MAADRATVGQRKRDRTRTLLVEAAARVFARVGPDAPGMEDFATEAGVARGTVYNYFETKEELLVAVATAAIETIQAEIVDVRRLRDPADRLACTIRRYVHRDGVQSAQLVMGVTTLDPGSVWNTMPCHTHHRRTEIYLYFDLPADAILLHLMGEPTETRTLVVRDGDVALSPGWSVHAGCATTAYSFCWAMGGENQDYADMQPVAMTDLR